MPKTFVDATIWVTLVHSLKLTCRTNFIGLSSMDMKASAKSKRAHSQQGRRTANSSSKTALLTTATAASTNSGNAKKPHKYQGEKPHAHTSPAVLPSNWDRYEKQDDYDFEDSVNHSKQVDVRPKSKGADYAYLISQAQAQGQDLSHLQGLDSFDASPHDIYAQHSLLHELDRETALDFKQGFGSLLLVRGKSLLSWSGEDSFNVDDDATSSCEASFLSIDLHSLAAQLEKIDLPKRLFIEEDLLLPMELHAGGPAESSSQGYEGVETSCASDAEQGHAPLAVRDCAEAGKNADNNNGLFSLPVTLEDMSTQAVDGLAVEQRDQNEIKDHKMLDQSDLREVLDSMVPIAENVGENTKEKKSQRFMAAAAAEAELDVLLGSFGETKLLDSLWVADEPGFSGVNGASTISLNMPAAHMMSDLPPCTTTRVSKEVLDDFNSWLDTI